LIAGDICANAVDLALSTVYEDVRLGIQSITKAAEFEFDKAVVGHGKPVMSAANKKLKKSLCNKIDKIGPCKIFSKKEMFLVLKNHYFYRLYFINLYEIENCFFNFMM